MPTNGRLDLSTLTLVDGWAYLEPATARAWIAACDELVALGYPRPTITKPDGAYRDYDAQVWMKAYWTAQGIPLNAATPGDSNHGFGTCVDIYENWRWPRAVLVKVMGKHGFVFDYPPELWHAHRTSINPADSGVTTASLDATKIEQEEDDMSRIIHHPNGSMALAGSDGTFVPLTTMDEVAALIGTGAAPKDYVNLADGLMWDLRTAIAARKAAQSSSNPQSVAASLAPLIVPAVVSALGTGLTREQVEQATEAAVRAVFADAATK